MQTVASRRLSLRWPRVKRDELNAHRMQINAAVYDAWMAAKNRRMGILVDHQHVLLFFLQDASKDVREALTAASAAQESSALDGSGDGAAMEVDALPLATAVVGEEPSPMALSSKAEGKKPMPPPPTAAAPTGGTDVGGGGGEAGVEGEVGYCTDGEEEEGTKQKGDGDGDADGAEARVAMTVLLWMVRAAVQEAEGRSGGGSSFVELLKSFGYNHMGAGGLPDSTGDSTAVEQAAELVEPLTSQQYNDLQPVECYA